VPPAAHLRCPKPTRHKPRARQSPCGRSAESTPCPPCKGSRIRSSAAAARVKHCRRALDALDELKLGLLSGTLEPAALLRLKAVAADLQDGSGDEKLDQVLSEIELRVAVELAKAGIN
jgi:hypothetical protein